MLDLTKNGGMPRLETKDDAPAPLTKDDIRDVMTAFETFKEKNDERLAELEKKGASDPLLNDQLDKINAKLDDHEKFSEAQVKAEAVERQLKELSEDFARVETALKRSGIAQPESKSDRIGLWAKGVYNALVTGEMNLPDEQKSALEEVRAEYKALNVGTDTAGGYLAPIDLIREITKGVTEISPVRALARVRQTSLKAVQIPRRTGTFAAVWASELGSISESTGLAYGMDEAATHRLTALIDLSEELFEDAFANMEAEIRTEAEEQFAYAEGAAFVNGSGTDRPEGFMVNSDVGTTNSGAATTVTADSLLEVKHAVKTAYTRAAHFVMNRTTLGAIRKLKDSNNQYLWAPGIAAGKPNTIDGDPYMELPDMPDEGAGLKPVAYGDFYRAYSWVDRLQMSMLRDNLTQAAGGKVRFILRKRVGGVVTLPEALRTITCST